MAGWLRERWPDPWRWGPSSDRDALTPAGPYAPFGGRLLDARTPPRPYRPCPALRCVC